jgi:enterochelin esterase-like enzyme
MGIALSRPGYFGALGIFASGLPPKMESFLPDVAANPKEATRDLRPLLFGCGKSDAAMPPCRGLAKWFGARGIPYQFHEYDGAHDWAVWSRCLVDIAPQLFQDAR